MRIPTLTVILFASLLLGGCGFNAALTPSGDQTRFYRIDCLVPDSSEALLPESQVMVLVGPSSVAKYLDRSQIATLRGANEVAYSEFNRWSESLKAGIERTLIVNLTTLLSSSSVGNDRSIGDEDVDFRVGYEVLDCGGDIEGDVELRVSWWLEDNVGERILFLNESYSATSDGTYPGYVAAINDTVSQWSQSVARGIAVQTRN